MILETLISTIITSTAALIAIIGGFLVSRVIALSSEQNGINRKLREINNEITAKEDTLSRVKDYIMNEDAFDFIRDNVEEISIGKVSLEEVHKKDQYTKLSVKQLDPYVKEYKSIFNEVLDYVRKFSSVPSDFYEFKRKLTTECIWQVKNV